MSEREYTTDQIEFMMAQQAVEKKRTPIRVAINGHVSPRQIVDYANSDEERARKKSSQLRNRLLNDSWECDLALEIQSLFRPVIAKEMMGQLDTVDTSRNIAKNIWEEEAVLYKQPALRLSKSDGAVEAYNEITHGTKFQMFWQRVELLLKAHNDVVIYPTVDAANGKLKHCILTPDQCTVICGADQKTPTAIVMCDQFVDISDGESRIVHHIWTLDGFFIYDEKYNKVIFEKPNEYFPSLPFVFIHANPFSPSFWDYSTGNDLVRLTLNTGIDRVQSRYHRKMNTMKQLLIVGSSINEVRQQLRDTGSIIKIEGDALSAQIVDWQTNTTAEADVIDRDEIRAAASRGINPERMRKSSYQSSTVAQYSERALVERRDATRTIFEDAEQQYYQLVAKLFGLDSSAKIDMVYAPIEYKTDPLSQLAAVQQRIELGLSSVSDQVMAEHPLWSREEADDFVIKNITQNAEIAEIKMRFAIANNLTNRSSIDEQNGKQGPVVRDSSTSDSLNSVDNPEGSIN